MKLQELALPKQTQTIVRVFESYFDQKISVDRLNRTQTRSMLERVRGLLHEHRNTVNRHRSEREPAYLKLVMMEQALNSHLAEMTPPVQSTAQPAPGAAKPTTSTSQPAPGAAKPTTTTSQPSTSTSTSQPAFNPRDPKVQAAIKKSQTPGQKLNPEEQAMINAAAQTTQEGRLRRAFRTLKESEVQQAQVVLAAQDMVDSMQGMIEDSTEMQYKELPALVDSIRNQIGLDQANQFNTDTTAALTNLVQSLQGAKQSLETALSVVTGQAQPAPALDAAMAGAEPVMPVAGAEMPPEAGAEIPPAPEVSDEEPEAAGAPGALGRDRR